MHPEPGITSKPKIATAVLTRGYDLKSILNYRFIILRNWSITRTLLVQSRGVKTDHFVFHEGNITVVARMAISIASWPLRLRFVNLREFFGKFKQETNSKNLEKCPETPLSEKFSVEYRAMCAFWIDEFLTYLGDYDVILRVDEDCVLKSLNYETVFTPMIEGTVDYCAGMAFGFDLPDVTRGLEDFVIEWHEQHPGTRTPVFNLNPYTNLFLLRPKAVKSNPEALDFLRHVRSSGCVLNNRWGDHVIWGALLSMYGDTIRSNFAAEVSYFHGSHRAFVTQA
jgi:hypothetical protein